VIYGDTIHGEGEKTDEKVHPWGKRSWSNCYPKKKKTQSVLGNLRVVVGQIKLSQEKLRRLGDW